VSVLVLVENKRQRPLIEYSIQASVADADLIGSLGQGSKKNGKKTQKYELELILQL
jgi:hypothetical protein